MINGMEVRDVGQGLISIAFAMIFLQTTRRGQPRPIRIVAMFAVAVIWLFWVLWNWRILVFRPNAPSYRAAMTAACLGSWVCLYIFRVRLDIQGLIWMAFGALSSYLLPTGLSDPARLHDWQKTLFEGSVYLMWVGLGTVVMSSPISVYVLIEERHNGDTE